MLVDGCSRPLHETLLEVYISNPINNRSLFTSAFCNGGYRNRLQDIHSSELYQFHYTFFNQTAISLLKLLNIVHYLM